MNCQRSLNFQEAYNYNVGQGDDQAEQKTRMNEDGLAMV